MNASPHIGLICGSLRDGSINLKLTRALAERVRRAGAKAVIIDLGDYPMPFFHGGMERPETVDLLIEKMKSCDGIIMVTPEYNGCLPPLLKNVIDWTSTVGTEQFSVPVYGIAACTPGAMSGIMALRQLNFILTRLGAHVMPTQLGCGNAGEAFDDSGDISAEPASSLADKMIGQMMARLAPGA